MYSDDTSSSGYKIPSCSDCKNDFFVRQWIKVLLNWVNLCVQPGVEVEEINDKVLLNIINKYGDDICHDDLDEALLYTDNLEPFIKYKYPILRLRDLCEYLEDARKWYIMASVLLYHCCINSKSGVVDKDICRSLSSTEQELILKFCENLGQMEATINNVEAAITGAFDRTKGVNYNKLIRKRRNIPSIVMNQVKDTSSSEPNQELSILSLNKKPTFKSSVTILPSVSESTDYLDESLSFVDGSKNVVDAGDSSAMNVFNAGDFVKKEFAKEKHIVQTGDGCKNPESCACISCMKKASGEETPPFKSRPKVVARSQLMMQYGHRMWAKKTNVLWVKWLKFILILVIITGVLIAVYWFQFMREPEKAKPHNVEALRSTRDEVIPILATDILWECKDRLCQRIYRTPPPRNYYISLNRCTLLCSGPQLWPIPIGYKYFSNKLVALAKNKLEYKFQTIPSAIVHEYLAEAFKLFLGDKTRLERMDLKMTNATQDLPLKKLYVQIDVESDTDPKLRLDTEESYTLTLETKSNQVKVTINAASFAGARHGLETLSQLILLDQSTGYLITLSNAVIKDAPSYKYRGLMIDTARNFIPVPDLLRTLDAMATVKLNTFHWRISDVTSFPLLLPNYPQLFEYGGYDRSMVYTVEDVRTLVNRAGFRGIRILIEVAAPGPVGRPWSWNPDAACLAPHSNFSCDDLCLRLKITESVFDVLQHIYSTIIELTKVDDIIHLSNGIFSFINCYHLLDTREGYLDKALARLRLANKGFLPKLPIVWYTGLLTREYETRVWQKYGVQLNEWQINLSDDFLSKYKVIHSSRWDLSCEMRNHRCSKYRTWQEMYAWKSWRNLEALTIEGGEAVLWTDLVDTTNLDTHLWPRAAAVAERLWSDIAANHTASSHEYLRLDAQRWRMLLRSIKVQPIWPMWCSFNPRQCLYRLH